MNKYILELDEEQLKLIQSALDLRSRIQMGQLEELVDHFNGPLRHLENEKLNNAKEKIQEVKEILFPELSGSAFYGIKNNSLPIESQRAYDMVQVIRREIALKNKPQGGITVNFDQPIRYSDKEFIKVSSLEDNS